jgi:hypothetical protein
MNSTTDHQHEWIDTTADGQPRGYSCATCADTASACTQCDRPIHGHLIACDRCIDRAKTWVQDVIDAIATVPFHHAEIMGLRSPRYDRDVVTGGGNRDRLPFNLDAIVEDVEDARIEAAKHPDTAVDILRDWADAWSDTRGDTPTDRLRYLVDHTQWAIQNPDASGWEVYRAEARRVRSTVRRLLGLQPVHEPAPCVQCGGDVIREWLTDGLDDTRRCTRCGSTWPDTDSIRHTNHLRVLAAAVTDPDTLVTAEQARLALPDLKRNTLNVWLKRDRERVTTGQPREIPERGMDVRGGPLYRLGDIATRAGLNTAGSA